MAAGFDHLFLSRLQFALTAWLHIIRPGSAPAFFTTWGRAGAKPGRAVTAREKELGKVFVGEARDQRQTGTPALRVLGLFPQ